MINTVILEGYLFKDFSLNDVVKTSNGKDMLPFSFMLAGNTEKKTFVSCLAFDKTATYLLNYGKKGSKIFVNGSITGKEKDGKQYSLTVLVNSVSLIPKHNDTNENTTYNNEQSYANANQFADTGTQTIIDENDLPF